MTASKGWLPQEAIRIKRDGGALDGEDLQQFVTGITTFFAHILASSSNLPSSSIFFMLQTGNTEIVSSSGLISRFLMRYFRMNSTGS
jgi:hypothetical protein